jgi:hypothetical protein
MKGMLISILLAFVFAGCRPAENSPAKSQFVFVRVPEQIGPIDRGKKYEDPLDAVLKKEGVGEVSGGGTQLSAPDATGKKSIEWVGIDVDLSDFSKGLPILKRELLRLGAPHATVLEYTRDGKKTEERLQ